MATPSQINKLQRIINPLIRQRYLKYFQLPQSLRQIMFSAETADKIKKISEKNNLNDAQTWSISYITGMIILGETNIIDFLQSIKKDCDLEEDSARELARDINKVIFLPVKDNLKVIHRVSEWPRENENKTSTMPQINGNIVDLKEK